MKYKKNLLSISCVAITIINLIANSLLLRNQIYQGDPIFYSVISIIILIVFIILNFLIKRKKIKLKRKWLKLSLFFLFLFLLQTSMIYYQNKIIVIGKEIPISFELTHFSYHNYEYYSYNSYADVILKVGKKRYTFYQLANMEKEKKKFLIQYFHLKKRSTRKKIMVKLSNKKERNFVKSDGLGTDYYYYGIKDIILYYDNKTYHYQDNNYPLSLKKNTTLKDIDHHFNAYYVGESYHIVDCFYKEQSLSKAYVIPTSMKIDSLENFCNNK